MLDPLSAARGYRFCSRCWMPVAPVFACHCAPEARRASTDAELAAVAAEFPRLHLVRADVAAGRYRDDRGIPHLWRLDFVRWLVEQGRLTGDTAPAESN